MKLADAESKRFYLEASRVQRFDGKAIRFTTSFTISYIL